MTCGEFLKALEEHPDAELIFEKMTEPDIGNGRLCQQFGNLILWCGDDSVRVTCDPYK